MERLPNENQLNVEKTFEDQKDVVNLTIVPAILKLLDRNTFPITSGVVYDILHNHHRHQREEHLKKGRSSTFQDKQNRRRHGNSRRSDVSKESAYDILFYF
jgi:hypothetical protein